MSSLACMTADSNSWRVVLLAGVCNLATGWAGIGGNLTG